MIYPSKKFQDNFALAIISLIIKRELIMNGDSEGNRQKLAKEFDISVNILNEGLEHLRRIKKKYEAIDETHKKQEENQGPDS